MKITIETDETGGERCQVTLESGVSYEFEGRAVSELRLTPGQHEEVDVSTGFGPDQHIRGRWVPDEWTFTVTVDRIRELVRRTDGETR